MQTCIGHSYKKIITFDAMRKVCNPSHSVCFIASLQRYKNFVIVACFVLI